MSELLLKVGDRSSAPEDWKDGDIMCAFSRRRIRQVHAEMICHRKAARRNASGLLQTGGPSQALMNVTRQYRFERVSATEVMRINQFTGVIDKIGPTPNERGEYMDVREFIARRRKDRNNGLFGEDGAEIWYGGKTDFSDAKLSAVWTRIETDTPLREADHQRFPLGTQDVISHLPIATDDFDDDAAAELTQEELGLPNARGVREVLQRRLRDVPWRDVLRMTDKEIERAADKRQAFDLRDREAFSRLEIVRAKTPRLGRV